MTKGYARFLTVLFCLFLGGLMVWQLLLPDRERSDVENRTLQQRPALTLSGVLDGSYMEDVESYVQDQFPLRDQWTGLKARTEQLIGKRLFNNIYLCEGETLIYKVDEPADGLEETNLHYVTQLAGNTDIPVYLVGVAVAAVVGYACIRLLKMIADKGKFGWFAYYCWTAGLIVLALTLVLK